MRKAIPHPNRRRGATALLAMLFLIVMPEGTGFVSSTLLRSSLPPVISFRFTRASVSSGSTRPS